MVEGVLFADPECAPLGPQSFADRLPAVFDHQQIAQRNALTLQALQALVEGRLISEQVGQRFLVVI